MQRRSLLRDVRTEAFVGSGSEDSPPALHSGLLAPGPVAVALAATRREDGDPPRAAVQGPVQRVVPGRPEAMWNSLPQRCRCLSAGDSMKH